MATHGKKAVNTFVFDGVCHIFNFDKKNALGPPNPYEVPGCQEADFPCERIFCVFSAVGVRAQSASGCVI